MRRSCGGIRCWQAAALLCAILAGTALADFKRDYGEGKRSFQDGDYPNAVQALQKAIADNPKADPQVRIYGMRFEPYLPHYYLGAARFKLGDCAGALKEWKESEAQGVIKNASEYADMQRDRAVCQSQVVDVSSIAQAATGAIDKLDAEIKSFAAIGNEPLLHEEWQSQFAPELQQKQGLAAALRKQLAKAVDATDPDAIETVTKNAQDALSSVNGSVDLANARLQALRQEQASQVAQRQEQAQRELRQAVAAAKAVQPASGGSEQMASLTKDLGSQVAKADGMGDNATVEALRGLTQDINNTLRRYQQAEQEWRVQKQAAAYRTPPPLLKQVAQAYFSGDYASTARLATPDKLSEDREKVQAFLFRAAANYKLYVLSGEQNSDLLKQAQDDIRAIKRLNNTFSPYIGAFSPNFLDLFKRTS